MVDTIIKNMCTGCSSCMNICPKEAIKMISDSEGFNYPVIDRALCIECMLCEKVCPSLNLIKENHFINMKIYAAWSLNEVIRNESTSGGIFSEIALEILDCGGYICGAIYNEEFGVEHYITNKVSDLSKIRQSKYVQSDMNYIYKEILKLLVNEKKVLFCGSPCECAGINHYLNINKINCSRLILVDFVCRGANSPKVYKSFLDSLEKKYQSKINKVWFKNKKYGWNRFSTKIEFANGHTYLEDRFNDIYIRGYIESNLFIRPSCSQCLYKGFPKSSDITLADFWGIKLEDKTKNTDLGTSLVILNSDIGIELFENIKSRIFYESNNLESAIEGNYCINNSIIHGENRTEFMSSLETMDIIDNIKRFLQ